MPYCLSALPVAPVDKYKLPTWGITENYPLTNTSGVKVCYAPINWNFQPISNMFIPVITLYKIGINVEQAAAQNLHV